MQWNSWDQYSETASREKMRRDVVAGLDATASMRSSSVSAKSSAFYISAADHVSDVTRIPVTALEDYTHRIDAARTVAQSDSSATQTAMHICPICDRRDFQALHELTRHVENHFADDDTVG